MALIDVSEFLHEVNEALRRWSHCSPFRGGGRSVRVVRHDSRLKTVEQRDDNNKPTNWWGQAKRCEALQNRLQKSSLYADRAVNSVTGGHVLRTFMQYSFTLFSRPEEASDVVVGLIVRDIGLDV